MRLWEIFDFKKPFYEASQEFWDDIHVMYAELIRIANIDPEITAPIVADIGLNNLENQLQIEIDEDEIFQIKMVIDSFKVFGNK